MEGRLSGPRRILLVASFMYMILSSLSESFSSGRGILNNKKQHHPWLTGEDENMTHYMPMLGGFEGTPLTVFYCVTDLNSEVYIDKQYEHGFMWSWVSPTDFMKNTGC